MSVYVLRDPEHGYFRGLMDDEDVVWTQRQARALRFRNRDLAVLAIIGHYSYAAGAQKPSVEDSAISWASVARTS